MRSWKVLTAVAVMALLFGAGCGGDNLAFCNGCTTPTPTPEATDATTTTPTGPIATPTSTPVL